jgi:hypothetical protein
MDYEGAKLRFHWNLTQPEPEASKYYTDDALVEFPQSGERFRGRENFSVWRGEYPVDTFFEVRSLRGEGDLWVVEGQAGYAGGEPMPFVDILHFRGDLIDRETIYLGGAFPPAEARMQYAETTPAELTPGMPMKIRTAD